MTLEHDPRFAALVGAVTQEAQTRLNYVHGSLVEKAASFKNESDGLIQSIKGPKPHEKSLAEEIAGAISEAIFVTGIEAEIVKETAKAFFHAATTHLGEVKSEGLDVQAVRGELTKSVAAFAQSFIDAAAKFREMSANVEDSVNQYLGGYLTGFPQGLDTISLTDRKVHGDFCNKIHILEGKDMDPSDKLYGQAKKAIQAALDRFGAAVKFADESHWDKLGDVSEIADHVRDLPASERRAYLESRGQDPSQWLNEDGDINESYVASMQMYLSSPFSQ